MSNHVYKTIEITGSGSSADEAMCGAVAKASETVRNIDWFEVTETRGHVRDNEIAYVQVTMKLGFRLE